MVMVSGKATGQKYVLVWKILSGGKATVVVSGKATGTAMATAMVMAKGKAIIHPQNNMFDNTLKSS
jgi:hypothetical protein